MVQFNNCNFNINGAVLAVIIIAALVIHFLGK